MIYRWRDGYQPPVEAQKAGEHLEKVRIRHNGFLSPRAVVEEARSKRSPIHPCFEWDDGKAAEQYREQQARHLIGALVTIVPQSETKTPVRAFVSVHVESEPAYTSMQHALSDAQLRAQVLAQAWREVQSWRKRYAEYRELADIFSAIDAQKGFGAEE